MVFGSGRSDRDEFRRRSCVHCAAVQKMFPHAFKRGGRLSLVHAPSCPTTNAGNTNIVKQPTHWQFYVKPPTELGNHDEITSNPRLHCTDSAVCRHQYTRQGSPATEE